MKVWVAEGVHHSTPGHIMKVCASKALADLEAVVMVNIIRKDLDEKPDATASDWEQKLEEIKVQYVDHFETMPDVWITEYEVIGS